MQSFHPYNSITININIESQKEFLEDFVICIGNIKASNGYLTDKKEIGKILQYLKVLLDVQEREKIYGFLCNYTNIKFFYVYKQHLSNSYEYYESQELELFSSSSYTSSSIRQTKRRRFENLTNLSINKKSWKIFSKFLTMNSNFYEYKRLMIDPYDDVFTNRYMIKKKLGNGFTSMVYLLEKTNSQHLNKNLQFHVIKILKQSSYSEFFLREIEIGKQLKKCNSSKKFNLFFQDILYSLSSGKIYFLSFLFISL